MRISKWLPAAVLGGMVALGGVAAQAANIISGSVWLVPSGISNNATIANKPNTTPDVTFDAPSTPLSFTSNGQATYNLGAFLGTGGAFNIVENTPGALANSTNDHYYYFSGLVSVINGQTFNVTHDDGFELKIGPSFLYSQPGPTAPVLTSVTYTGPTGTFGFEMSYGECCGPPAVLFIDLPLISQVPEPATLALFGAGLLGLGAVRRRRAA